MKGWVEKSLGELCEIARGGSPRPIQSFLTNDPSGINWIKISDATASGKYIYKTEEKIKPDGAKRSRVVKEGDFLLSNSMSFGRPYIMKTTGCIHDGWLVLSDKSGLFEQDYLYHFLGSDAAYRQFDALAAGSTVRNLNIDLAKRVRVRVPPLPEQRRIVAILDEAFAGLEAMRANTEKNLQNARDLFDSYLDAIFAQKGGAWTESNFEDCIDHVKYTQKVQRRAFLDDGVYPIISQESGFINGYWNNKDDLFVVRRPVIVFGDHTRILKFVDFNFVLGADGVKIIAPKRMFDPKFFFYALKQIPLGSKGYARHYGLLKEKVIAYPRKIDEQANVVGLLDSMSEDVFRLDALYKQKLAAIAELKQSILQRAFSGQLTSSDMIPA